MKAIIFDVDGTLLDTEKLYMQAWREAGAVFGYKVTEEALLRTRAVNSAVAEKVFQETVAKDFPYGTVRKERIRIAEKLIAETPTETLVMPGARQVLQEMRKRGVPMAVASSTPYEKTVAHLRHAELADFFDAVVCGDMVEKGKPEPDVFLKAAELLGVSAEDCLVVGDTPADVLAGTAAGMQVALIPDQVPANEETKEKSRWILDSIRQLSRHLEEAGWL